jgi:hypothetical protein
MLGTLKALARPLALVFQMGKVGSSTLETTLSRHFRGSVLHAHSLGSLPASQQRLIAWKRRLRLPIHVITPIREPIGRNVSAFFHNFKRDTGFELSDRSWSVAELCDLFLRCYPHRICLEWFDTQFLPAFGIDVYAAPFPIERKWQTYRHGSVRLLVYRTDLDHDLQRDVVKNFLGLDIERFEFTNRADDKDYAEVYRRFVAEAALPEWYISRMHRSRFACHFWSAEERREQACEWQGVGAMAPAQFAQP